MTEAIALEDVEVRVAGAGTILGPVTMHVRSGERWALLGPNGSGKTTLLSVAGAWRQPSSGRARVLGGTLGRADVRAIRARIGHVGHTVNERLRTGLRVRDVVLTGRSSTLETWFQTYGPEDIAEADARLAQVGCGGMADRPLATCSQGERARVLLARALFGRRALMLFDEPAAGLDLVARELLVAAMDATAGVDGPTSVLATHHLEEIPASTTHAALLRAGRIVAQGDVGETLSGPSLSETFGIEVVVERRRGRWSAFAAR